MYHYGTGSDTEPRAAAFFQAGWGQREGEWLWMRGGRRDCRVTREVTRSKDLQLDPSFHGMQVCTGPCFWLLFSTIEARGWRDHGYRCKHPPDGKGPNDTECGRSWQHHSGITGLICQSSVGEVLEFRVTVEKQSLKCWRENVGKCKAQPLGLTSKTVFLGGQGIFQVGNCHWDHSGYALISCLTKIFT